MVTRRFSQSDIAGDPAADLTTGDSCAANRAADRSPRYGYSDRCIYLAVPDHSRNYRDRWSNGEHSVAEHSCRDRPGHLVTQTVHVRNFYLHHPELDCARHVQPGNRFYFDARPACIAPISKIRSHIRRTRHFSAFGDHFVAGPLYLHQHADAIAILTADVDSCAEWRGEDLLVRIRVQPGARRNDVLGTVNQRLRIRTTAVPADGKANKAVIRLLAEYLQVPVSRIKLIGGHTHRNKRVIVRGPVLVPDDLPVATRAGNGL